MTLYTLVLAVLVSFNLSLTILSMQGVLISKSTKTALENQAMLQKLANRTLQQDNNNLLHEIKTILSNSTNNVSR